MLRRSRTGAALGASGRWTHTCRDEMSLPSVEDVFQTYLHRFLAEGVPYRDLLDGRARISTMSDWCSVWTEFARAAEERASRAAAAGFAVTAGAELVRAATYYFFAQFILWDDPGVKRSTYEAAVRTLEQAGPHLDPPLVRLAIPFGPVALPAHLRRPRHPTRPPCVILLGGVDTTKEEQIAISELCLERGRATLPFDGPGQGGPFSRLRLPLTPDFHDAVSAVLDFLTTRDDIDPARLGVVGRSLGSYYAAKGAALDRRIKAVVSWGGMYELADPAALPPTIRDGF